MNNNERYAKMGKTELWAEILKNLGCLMLLIPFLLFFIVLAVAGVLSVLG